MNSLSVEKQEGVSLDRKNNNEETVWIKVKWFVGRFTFLENLLQK